MLQNSSSSRNTWCGLETRPPNIEGKGAVTTRDWLKNALRMLARTDHYRRMPRRRNARHAPGHEHRPQRFDDHAAREYAPRGAEPPRNHDHDGGVELPLKAMRQQISAACDLIIQANRPPGRPAEDHEHHGVMNMEQDVSSWQEIFRYKQLGIDQNGRAYGAVRSDRCAADLRPRLEQKGIKLPSNMSRSGCCPGINSRRAPDVSPGSLPETYIVEVSLCLLYLPPS